MDELTLFIVGYIFCMICDVLFSIANYFVQKSLTYRTIRKNLNDSYNALFKSKKDGSQK